MTDVVHDAEHSHTKSDSRTHTHSIESGGGENTEIQDILLRKSTGREDHSLTTQRSNKLLSLSRRFTPHSLHRMKSNLDTPQSVLMKSRSTDAVITGRTIANALKSSVDVILYDEAIEDEYTDTGGTDGARSTTGVMDIIDRGKKKTSSSAPNKINGTIDDADQDSARNHSQSALASSRKLNRGSQSADESEGDGSDDNMMAGERTDRATDRGRYNALDNRVGSEASFAASPAHPCNVCGWLRKYKTAMLLTATCWAGPVTLSIVYPDPDKMSFELLSVDFCLSIAALLSSTRLFWKLVSYMFFVCSIRRCCRQRMQKVIFYITYSEVYISASLSTSMAYAMLLWFEHYPDGHRYDRVLERIPDDAWDALSKWLLCALALCLALFLKTLLVRWVCLNHYLAQYLVKIKKMRKYEMWLATLLQTKDIFSVRVKEFLDINTIHATSHMDADLHTENGTVPFRLDALVDQDEFDLDANNNKLAVQPTIDEAHDVNERDSDFTDDDEAHDRRRRNKQKNNVLFDTLTSPDILMSYVQKEYAHTAQSGLLWLYNAKTETVTMIDDTELDKLCKLFAKYVFLSVTKSRFAAQSATNVSSSSLKHGRPTFNDLTHMFHANMRPRKRAQSASSTTNFDYSASSLHNAANSNISLHAQQFPFKKPPPQLRRSSRSKTTDVVNLNFVSKKEFLSRFLKRNKRNQGMDAWKHMNISDKHLSKKELQRWLYQYLHDLIYLKQSLDSYEAILKNLDFSGNVITIFLMCFVFLLIFEFDFQSSVSTYAALFAVFAIFGRNIFTSWFDAIYFVFVLQPYEVGDVVLIDDVRYSIKGIEIMYSEMLTSVSNGNTVILKNNALLLGKDIKNLSKTKTPYHNISFYVSQLATMQQLRLFKKKMEEWIQRDMKNELSDMWFIMDGVDGECRMKISLFVRSFYAFSDAKTMWRQYHNIHWQIKTLINEMGIHYKRFSAQDVQLSALIDDANKN